MTQRPVDVRTSSGILRGEERDGMAVFRGIPFAAAPTGSRRFRPPTPPERWDGVRPALIPSPGCPQPTMEGDPEIQAFFNPDRTDADCLQLDVWTPDPAGGGMPVMVWIHGGGYLTGGASAPVHDGSTWARDGIVYVAINYRLNVEGFLYLGPGTANLGLLDQVAGLRWVQENIAAFGGDPGNVTVFGQSAGAVSVMDLLAMPAAAGLFRRAIAQSGSTAAAVTVDEATEVAVALAGILGVAPTPEGFAEVPEERTQQAVVQLAFEFLDPSRWGQRSLMISPFTAVVDGETLPAPIVSAVAGGASANVDLLAGTTRDELTFAMQPLGLLDHLDEAWVALALQTFGLEGDALEVYRRSSRAGADRGELMQAAWTDWAFRIPTLRLLEAHAPHPGSTYCYEFTWPSPLPKLGSTHALDLAFVTDRIADHRAALEGPRDLLGPDAPQALADALHRAWIDFATHGKPGWDTYDTSTRTTMRFDASSEAVPDLAGAERALWERIR